jgi:hypothetical protein
MRDFTGSAPVAFVHGQRSVDMSSKQRNQIPRSSVDDGHGLANQPEAYASAQASLGEIDRSRFTHTPAPVTKQSPDISTLASGKPSVTRQNSRAKQTSIRRLLADKTPASTPRERRLPLDLVPLCTETSKRTQPTIIFETSPRGRILLWATRALFSSRCQT